MAMAALGNERVRRSLLAATILVVSPLTGAPALAQASFTYSPVTQERLLEPESRNWLHIRRTYDGWGYSPLDQIDAANVAKLSPAWTFATSVNGGHQSPPIVNDGVMFVTTPGSQVIALDARSGDQLWRYVRELPDDSNPMHLTNRGVGLWGDKVYVATQDAHVVALDARTGSVVWDRAVADYKQGYYMTHRAAGRSRQGDGGPVGRRVRHSRLRRGARRGDRRRGVAPAHHSGARRAGQRELAGRHLADGAECRSG